MVYEKIHKHTSIHNIQWHFPFDSLPDEYCIKRNYSESGLKFESYTWKKSQGIWNSSIRHRTNGPAYYIRMINGHMMVSSVLGKAFISNKQYAYAWLINDKLHRYNGPALLTIDNSTNEANTNQWYLFGKFVEDFKYTKWADDNGIDLDNLSETDKILIQMKWG